MSEDRKDEELLIILLNLGETSFPLTRFMETLADKSKVAFHPTGFFRRTEAQRTPAPHLFDHVIHVRHAPTSVDLAKLAEDELRALGVKSRFAVADYTAINGAVRVQEKPVAIQLSFTSAKPERNDDFETWYETYHFPQGLQLPGFAGGQRFRKKATASEHAVPMAVVASYQIDTTNVQPTIDAIGERAGTPAFRLTDAMAPEFWALFFVPATAA